MGSEILEKIARDRLHFTLETKGNRNDFHEVAVWLIRDAMEDAYNAGLKESRKTKSALDIALIDEAE